MRSYCQIVAPDSPQFTVIDITDSPSPPVLPPMRTAASSPPLVPESPDAQSDQGRQDTLWHFEEMAADKPRQHSAYHHLLDFCHNDLLCRERGHYWTSLQDETIYESTFDLRKVIERRWSEDEGKFSLKTLIRLCDRIAETQVDSDEKALEPAAEDRHVFRYRFCQEELIQWDQELSEEGSDAHVEAEPESAPPTPPTPQPIDPTNPTNPEFGWAMLLNRNAGSIKLFQAASVLQTIARETAYSANPGSESVQRYLSRVHDRIQQLVSWATDFETPNIGNDDDEELTDERNLPGAHANTTQTNARKPKKHVANTNARASSKAKPVVPPLNATKPSNARKPANREPSHLPNYPPRELDGVQYPSKKEGVTACKLWNTTAGKQVLQNKKLTGGNRVVLQCAESLTKGILNEVSEDQLQCPYKAVLQKKTPKGGSEHWAYVGGRNGVYEHRDCGGQAKPTTNELVKMQTSCTAVKANRGVSGKYCRALHN